LFFRLLERYPFISGFSTRYPHSGTLSFLNFFKVLASGLPSAKFPPGLNL